MPDERTTNEPGAPRATPPREDDPRNPPLVEQPEGPQKRHGDALLDGPGTRQGQPAPRERPAGE